MTETENAVRQLIHDVYETVINDHRQMGGISPVGRRAAAEVASHAVQTYIEPALAAARAEGAASREADIDAAVRTGYARGYAEGERAGREAGILAAIDIIQGGSFLHEKAPPKLFADEVTAAIKRRLLP